MGGITVVAFPFWYESIEADKVLFFDLKLQVLFWSNNIQIFQSKDWPCSVPWNSYLWAKQFKRQKFDGDTRTRILFKISEKHKLGKVVYHFEA